MQAKLQESIKQQEGKKLNVIILSAFSGYID